MILLAVWMSACGGGEDGGGGARDLCEGVDCGGHGHCTSTGGSASCDCEDGWVVERLNCVPESGDSDADVDADADADTDTDTDSDTQTGPCDDLDGDGHGDVACGGDDCDDSDFDRHPGLPDGDGAGTWDIESIDPDTANGNELQADGLALDGDGHLEVAWTHIEGDYDVRWATNASGAWVVERILDLACYTTSVVITRRADPHVVCTDGNNLWHAYESSGVWYADPIDTLAERSSAARDAANHLHVVYVKRNGAIYELWHATDGGGAWATDRIVVGTADLVAADTSIVVDADGHLHVAYYDAGVKYATDASGVWVAEDVDRTVGGVPDPVLAIAPDGGVHMTYGDIASLAFATRDGGWSFENVGVEPGTPSDLAFDADGTPHVVYESLRYGTNGGGAWGSAYVEGGYAGSLVVDAEGGVHVAYSIQVGVMQEVHHAYRAPLDGIDQNCDGVDGVDEDGDGFASIDTGGFDCADFDASYAPGADDPLDGTDTDCDGQDG